MSKTYEDINIPGKIPPLKEYMRRNFGIIQGGKTRKVILKFSASISSWISELVWHPEQKAWHDEDGNLLLTIPVSDFKEIKHEILKFGAEVKVMAPVELIEEVKGEIRKMSSLY